MEEIRITKKYYLNLLIQIMKERFYDEDYINLNKQKLEVLNEILNLNGYVDFDFKIFVFKFKNKGYINKSKLENISFINNVDLNNINDLNTLTSYIGMYFNNIIYKLTTNNVLINSGITLETNYSNEIIKESFDCYNTDLLICSHLEQINKAYIKALDELFSLLFENDFSNINSNINIDWNILLEDIDSNKKYLEILNKKLSEYDYL